MHRAYHSFCHVNHLRDTCPVMAGGCGPLVDLPSHLKHILKSFPEINALLVTTSLSFPAPAVGIAIAGPKETFETPSTKSAALMKSRGLSMAPAASSLWPNEARLSRIAAVGRHDARLIRSSGAVDSGQSAPNVTRMLQYGNNLVCSEYSRTVERLEVPVCPSRFPSVLSYQSRRHSPFAKLRL